MSAFFQGAAASAAAMLCAEEEAGWAIHCVAVISYRLLTRVMLCVCV